MTQSSADATIAYVEAKKIIRLQRHVIIGVEAGRLPRVPSQTSAIEAADRLPGLDYREVDPREWRSRVQPKGYGVVLDGRRSIRSLPEPRRHFDREGQPQPAPSFFAPANGLRPSRHADAVRSPDHTVFTQSIAFAEWLFMPIGASTCGSWEPVSD